MILIPPVFKFNGDKNKSLSLKSEALQFYNFTIRQAEASGINFTNKSLTLTDGSIIEVSSKRNNVYNIRTGIIKIYSESGISGGRKGSGFVLLLSNFNVNLEDYGLSIWASPILLTVKDSWVIKSLNYGIDLCKYFINSIFEVIRDSGISLVDPSDSVSGIPVKIYDNVYHIINNNNILPIVNGIKQNNFIQYFNPFILADLHTYSSGPFIKIIDSNNTEIYYITLSEITGAAINVYKSSFSLLNTEPYILLATDSPPQSTIYVGDIPYLLPYKQTASYGDIVTTGGFNSVDKIKPKKSYGPLAIIVAHSTQQEIYTGGYVDLGHLTSYAYNYDKSHIDKDNLEVYPGIVLEYSRTMNIVTDLIHGKVLWYGTWPYSEPLYPATPNYRPAIKYEWFNHSTYITYEGDGFTNVGSDDGFWMTSYDNTERLLTCTSLPKDIQKIITSSSSDGFSGTHEFLLMQSDPTPPVTGSPYVIVDTTTLNPSSIYTTNVSSYSKAVSVNIEVRDYLYCDFEENVFFYIELLAAGNYDILSPSSTFIFNAVLDYRGNVFSKEIYRRTDAIAIDVARKDPDDVSLLGLDINQKWQNPNPSMPLPIFSPMWMNQGDCPYIAYTTKDEVLNTEMIDEMLFTIKLQLIKSNRGVGEDIPLAPSGTLTVKIPNIEKVSQDYSFVSVLDALELLWPNIRFSTPSSTSDDWIKDLLPADWYPSIEATGATYPTVGTFNKNDNDLFTGQVYRT